MIGKILNNRYRVDELIGRGSMAEVYKVWDSRRGTYLALKLLREDFAQDPVFLRRFRREAQTLAKLQHPGIVRFYGLEQDDIYSYILMDLVEGESLRTEIYRNRKEKLGFERIIQVMRVVCSALQYAHQEGLVHCDLKPGNLMVESTGRIFISDFGIARMTDAATATMIGAGTPAFMAPEQIRGQDPIPQTDIYALGIVLFEMLTGGERPFTGENANTSGSTADKVRWEQLNLRPPSPKQWNPAVTPQLEALVMRCLEKDPQKRYSSPIDLLNALELAIGAVESSPELIENTRLKIGRQVEPADALTQKERRLKTKSKRIPKSLDQPNNEITSELNQKRIRLELPRVIFVIFIIILVGMIFSMGKSNTGMQIDANFTTGNSITPTNITNTTTPINVSITQTEFARETLIADAIMRTTQRAKGAPTLTVMAEKTAVSMISTQTSIFMKTMENSPITNNLEGIVVVRIEDFDVNYDETTNYRSPFGEFSYPFVSESILKLAGNFEITSPDRYSIGKGILILLSYEAKTSANISLINGSWNQNHKRWGVHLGSWDGLNPKFYSQVFFSGGDDPRVETPSFGRNFLEKPGVWYYLFLGIIDETEFATFIWEKENPSNSIIYYRKLPNWPDDNWQLLLVRAQFGNRPLYIDSITEIEFDNRK